MSYQLQMKEIYPVDFPFSNTLQTVRFLWRTSSLKKSTKMYPQLSLRYLLQPKNTTVDSQFPRKISPQIQVKSYRMGKLFDCRLQMNFKNNNNKNIKQNSAINSAALQDHLLRKFNFNFQSKITVGGKESVRKKTHEKLPVINTRVEKEIKKLQGEQKRSILPYEDETLKKLKEVKSDEQKMFKYNKGLTLAQRLGLVEAPPLPLTAKDWQAIEQKSKARNDSQNCCSICLEDFKIEPQLILSCSHVFHMKCLNSYQKHNKAKCCPICRRRDYQKKVIDEAIKAFTLKSILRIQRVFRGSQAKISIYGLLVQQGYACKSVRFNRRLIGYKMWRLSHKIEDRVKKSQKYFEKMIQNVMDEHQKSKEDILDQMVAIQRNKLIDQDKIEQYLDRLGIQRGIKKEQIKIDWEKVKEKGVNRHQDECAICLSKLWSKPVYLLSCTHLFHVNCIQGFQRYALPGNKNKCPCCRSHYQKKMLKEK